MDIYSEVTSRIIAQMENGVIPWQKPWVACGKAISRTTGKPYSLLNQLMLGRPGEYLTFKQCQEAGGKVKKGAKSSMVVFWKWIETEDEETGEKKGSSLPAILQRLSHRPVRRRHAEAHHRNRLPRWS